MSDVTGRDVVLALCARNLRSAADPLAPREFWALLGQLASKGLAPEGLLDTHADLGLDDELARRLEARLELVDEIDELEADLRSEDLWVLTPVDEAYPLRLRQALGGRAPVLLFGAGAQHLLSQDSVAVVGSRSLSSDAETVAEELGTAVAEAGHALVSGGARGADTIATSAALDNGGVAVSVLAQALDREAKRSEARELAREERLCLITPYQPSMGFTVANAMGRNKIIYGLARCTAVVAADLERGGTWAGASEALRHELGRVAVWTGDGEGTGNAGLRERGARPFSDPEAVLRIADEAQASETPGQLSLEFSHDAD